MILFAEAALKLLLDVVKGEWEVDGGQRAPPAGGGL